MWGMAMGGAGADNTSRVLGLFLLIAYPLTICGIILLGVKRFSKNRALGVIISSLPISLFIAATLLFIKDKHTESFPTFHDEVHQRLAVAIKNGDLAQINRYLEKKNNLNATSTFSPRQTLLAIAFSVDRKDIFEVLLQEGADPNYFDKWVGTSTAVSILRPKYQNRTNRWSRDATIGSRVEYLKLLFQYGLEPNLNDGQMSLLKYAQIEGELLLIQLLINNGADINFCGNGSTALDGAVFQRQWEVFNYIFSFKDALVSENTLKNLRFPRSSPKTSQQDIEIIKKLIPQVESRLHSQESTTPCAKESF